MAQYFAPKNGQVSFSHDRMLRLWSPDRVVSGAGGAPDISAHPVDFDLAGLFRSALRCRTTSTTASGQESESWLEYGLKYSANGTKLNLSGSGQTVPQSEFDGVTVVAEIALDWTSLADSTSGPGNGQYGVFLEIMGSGSGQCGAVAQRGNGGWGRYVGGTGPTASAPTSDAVRLWSTGSTGTQHQRVRVHFAPSSGAADGLFSFDVWDGAAWVNQFAVSNHTVTTKPSRIRLGCRVDSNSTQSDNSLAVHTASVVWDTDASAAGPADPAYNRDRAIDISLGDQGEDTDGVFRQQVRAYCPGGEFSHAAPAVRVSAVTGADPGLADGVETADSVTLAASTGVSDPGWCGQYHIAETGAAALGRGQTVYWRPRLTVDPAGAADVVDLGISSFRTLPSAASPATITLGVGSCVNASGDTHPVLAYRAWQQRDVDMVFEQGDIGYAGIGTFDRSDPITGPFAADNAEDMLTALLPVCFDEHVSVLRRSRPTFFMGDDHDGSFCVNNWHRGFADTANFARASRLINSVAVPVTSVVGTFTVGERLTGSNAGGTGVYYLGQIDADNYLVAWSDITDKTMDNGETFTGTGGGTLVVNGATAEHGWTVGAYGVFRVTAAEMFSRASGFNASWRSGGYLNLGGLEDLGSGAPYANASAALADGAHYRSFVTAKTAFYLVETRAFQEPVDRDTPTTKPFFGSAQKAWIEAKIAAQTEPLAVLACQSVMGNVHSDDDNIFANADWRQELADLGAAIDANPAVTMAVFLVGDRHCLFLHRSRVQGSADQDTDPGRWSLGTSKGIEFDPGPINMSATLDNFHASDAGSQYNFEQARRAPHTGRTSGWVDLIPAGAEAFDAANLDPDLNGGRGVLFSSMLAKNTDTQGQSPPKRLQACGVVEIDEAAETVTFIAFDAEADLASPVVGDAGSAYEISRELYRHTASFSAPAAGGGPGADRRRAGRGRRAWARGVLA